MCWQTGDEKAEKGLLQSKNMLPFQNRLTKRRDIEAVFKRGSFFSFKEISLKVAKNDLEITRIGVAVGLKYSKKAVERNAIKRQIRERVHKKLNRLKSGLDIVFMPRRNEKGKTSWDDLDEMITKLLESSNLIG
jgi:ribonuclease P protein component